jgi:quinohemoprotein ethanol dehydrogenase
MQHHAELGQINRASVSKLGLAWAVDMPTTNGLVGNPLIKDGVIYQGGPFGQIYANDLKTGKQLWVFKAEMPVTGTSFSNYIAYHMNRGIALSGDDVIIAANCDLIAVDQKTGKLHWRSQSCDAKGDDVGITAAPRVGDGLVFTGNACMDAGDGRGFVDAFDIRTGERSWRFYTAPNDPSKPQDSPLYEMAAKTWGEDWYGKTKGCASVWEAITFDQKLHQVYIGTGGPSPWQPSNRGKNAGDELFTNSIVALDARTGAYKWHFKQVPHDAWNYEARYQ